MDCLSVPNLVNAVSDHVLVMDDAGVRQITLARPDKKNALTQAMYAAVIAALEQGDSDPAVRVFVITGQGSAFTSGNDLADFAAAPPRRRAPRAHRRRRNASLLYSRKPANRSSPLSTALRWASV
jgi:enoyl-CoA hydratase/carnithine racemase